MVCCHHSKTTKSSDDTKQLEDKISKIEEMKLKVINWVTGQKI